MWCILNVSSLGLQLGGEARDSKAGDEVFDFKEVLACDCAPVKCRKVDRPSIGLQHLEQVSSSSDVRLVS
jgi:hypothetical protein